MRRNKLLSRLGVMLAGVLALLVAAWMVLFPVPRFPTPTGPHQIGTRSYHWVDSSRPEPFTSDPNDQRELNVQVWYPATFPAGTPTTPYIQRREVIDAIARLFHVPAFMWANLRRAHTQAVRDAQPVGGEFPVLLNPTGFGGYQGASLFWIEELVSQGYVVVTLDQPGTAAATVSPDGRMIPVMQPKAEFDRFMPLALSKTTHQTPVMNGVPLPGGVIPFLARDLSFTLDGLARLNRADPMLKGHLNTAQVGVFGMSLGGYVGPEACRQDARFRACLAVDAGQTVPVAQQGLSQPVMIMTRDADVMRQERARAGGWPEPEIAHTVGDERALFGHNKAESYLLTMNNMYHVNWTDAPLLTPLVKWMGLAGPVDPYRGFAATNAYTVAFFDRYLKGKDSGKESPLLQGSSTDWPEVKLDTRKGGAQ